MAALRPVDPPDWYETPTTGGTGAMAIALDGHDGVVRDRSVPVVLAKESWPCRTMTMAPAHPTLGRVGHHATPARDARSVPGRTSRGRAGRIARPVNMDGVIDCGDR
jgi:hypothetical protein